MLSFMELDEDPGLYATLARITLSPERQHQYRRLLDPASLALVERSLASHLAAWGYEAAAG
jgi:hypothetical protein